MPKSPKKPCREYGCPKFQEKEGYCTDHWQPRWKRQKDRSDHRYHTGNWQKIRSAKLTVNSICERCKAEPANTVHHIKPVEDGGDFWDWDNLMSLSRSCHEIIHGRKKER